MPPPGAVKTFPTRHRRRKDGRSTGQLMAASPGHRFQMRSTRPIRSRFEFIRKIRGCSTLASPKSPLPFGSIARPRPNGALMRSSDGGANWQPLTAGLPTPFESMVECIEFDPDQPDHILIGTGGEGARFIKLTEGEIFRSLDRGDHWEKIPLRFPIIYALAVQ
jgi:hypothetical protein